MAVKGKGLPGGTTATGSPTTTMYRLTDTISMAVPLCVTLFTMDGALWALIQLDAELMVINTGVIRVPGSQGLPYWLVDTSFNHYYPLLTPYLLIVS